MLTRGFIEKVHNAFDELNYHETERLNCDEFEQAAARTLTHCKDLSDAIDTVRLYQYCLKKWDAIERVFNRKLQIFNEFDYKGNSLISLVSDDDTLGTYYITNGINKKAKEVFVASTSFDEQIFELGFENGRFTVFDDGDYCIKYSKISSAKMKIFDNQNNCLCNVCIDKDLDVYFENNITSYEFVAYDGFIGIYDRLYIESLADTDIIDTNRLLADIEWDIIEENSDLGVAKLNVYKTDQDIEMLILFASSTFLVFQKYMQARKNQMYAICSWR